MQSKLVVERDGASRHLTQNELTDGVNLMQNALTDGSNLTQYELIDPVNLALNETMKFVRTCIGEGATPGEEGARNDVELIQEVVDNSRFWSSQERVASSKKRR